MEMQSQRSPAAAPRRASFSALLPGDVSSYQVSPGSVYLILFGTLNVVSNFLRERSARAKKERGRDVNPSQDTRAIYARVGRKVLHPFEKSHLGFRAP